MIRRKSMRTLVQLLQAHYPLGRQGLPKLRCNGARQGASFVEQWTCAVRAFSNASLGDDVIGIDLGVMNARVAVMQAQVPRVLESESGGAIPSFVAVGNKEILVGQIAKNHAIAYPTDVVFNTKALIGRRFDDPQIQKMRTTVPFKIIESNGGAWVEACNEHFSPIDVFSSIFGHLKGVAEEWLMRDVSKAVITAPVYFGDAQREGLELAAKRAGLDVLWIVEEPIAAALACKNIEDGIVAVFDMGSKTLDVSILEISDGSIKVKTTNGDPLLGGEDFDLVIVDYLLEEIERLYPVKISGDRLAMLRLKEAAEKAKVELSSSLETSMDFRHLAEYENAPIHANITLSRSKFEEIAECVIQRIRTHLERCLEDAGISADDVSEIIVVGGMSRVPSVQHMVEETFRKSPSRGVDPGDAVALGAALQGALLTEDKKKLLPGRIPLSLGIESFEGSFARIINRNSVFPCKVSRYVSTSSNDQKTACLRILQGEQKIATGNKPLGELNLNGIVGAPQGVPRLHLTFDVNKEGTLTVSAKNEDTGEEHSLKIHSIVDTDEEHVRMVVKEALLRGLRNRRKYILTKIRGCAKLKIIRIQNILKMRKEVPEDFVAEAEKALTELKNAVDSENVFWIRSKISKAESAGNMVLWNSLKDEYPEEEYLSD